MRHEIVSVAVLVSALGLLLARPAAETPLGGGSDPLLVLMLLALAVGLEGLLFLRKRRAR